jgi:cytidylate kinase
MATITISRQLGSMGREVARLVAERLGYRLVWRDLINQAARRAGAPELALAAIDELGLLHLTPSRQAREAYRQAVQQVVEELVTEGNVVILGRAGQVILHNRPGTLHVRLMAPVDVRAERLAHYHSIPIESALAQIEASDRHRRNYLKRFYGVRWDDVDLYDLVINTSRMTPEAAADTICQALAVETHRSADHYLETEEASLELD